MIMTSIILALIVLMVTLYSRYKNWGEGGKYGKKIYMMYKEGKMKCEISKDYNDRLILKIMSAYDINKMRDSIGRFKKRGIIGLLTSEFELLGGNTIKGNPCFNWYMLRIVKNKRLKSRKLKRKKKKIEEQKVWGDLDKNLNSIQ